MSIVETNFEWFGRERVDVRDFRNGRVEVGEVVLYTAYSGWGCEDHFGATAEIQKFLPRKPGEPSARFENLEDICISQILVRDHRIPRTDAVTPSAYAHVSVISLGLIASRTGYTFASQVFS